MTQIVGVPVADPKLPGRLYLSKDLCLTRDRKEALHIDMEDCKTLNKCLKAIQRFSTRYFVLEVIKPPH